MPAELFANQAVVPLTIVVIVVVAPITEEICFRGFIFTGLYGRGRPGATIAARWPRLAGAARVNGLLWGIIHGQVGLVVPIGGIGVVFARLLSSTGSLWNPILVHLVFNRIGVIGRLVQ